MLSGNVNVAVAGNGITLTAADASDHGVAIYRLDANHVEIDGTGGTTIGGSATKILNLSSVSSLTVNLGTEFDTYDIHDLNTTGNINVNGQMAGAVGAKVTIQAEHAAMTIGGSIIGNLGVQTTKYSSFYVDTAGQNLTVNGSINVTDAGAALEDLELFTEAGNLTVSGTVAFNENYSGATQAFEGIFTGATVSVDSLTINGVVNLTQSGSGPTDIEITTFFPNPMQMLSLGSVNITNTSTGNKIVEIDTAGEPILVKGSVTANLTGGTNGTSFTLISNGGSIAVNGSVSVSEADSSECDAGILANFANVTVANGLTITQSSQGAMLATIASVDKNTLSINGSVAVNQAGAGNMTANVDTSFMGSLVITGSVSFNQMGAGVMTTDIFTTGGPLTVNGVVSIGQSGSGATTDRINAGGGALTLGGMVDSLIINDSATGIKSTSLSSSSGLLLLLKGSFTANMLGGMHGTKVRLFTAEGNVTVKRFVSVTESDSSSNEALIDATAGNVNIGMGVAFSQSGLGNGMAAIETLGGVGTITIGPLGVSFNDSGPAGHESCIDTLASGSPIVINGSVRVVSTGQGNDDLNVISQSSNLGKNSPITINGNLTYDNSLNKTGVSDVMIYSISQFTPALLTITGALSLKLSSATNNAFGNAVHIGFNDSQAKSSDSLIVDGPTTVAGSHGNDVINIDKTRFKGPVMIDTLDSRGNGPSGFDNVTIDESEFDSALSIMMSGPQARVDINKTNFPFRTPTEFKGAVMVNMRGPGDSIHVADVTGLQPVKFDSLFVVLGGPGGSPAGTLYTLPGNVTFAFKPSLVNFAHSP
jgi:hypothetical protein